MDHNVKLGAFCGELSSDTIKGEKEIALLKKEWEVNEMRKRAIALITALLFGLSALAACGSRGEIRGPDATQNEPTAPAVSTGTQEPAPESAEMRFMWWGSDSRHEATLAVIDQYQTANPGIKIDGEYGGYDGYFESSPRSFQAVRRRTSSSLMPP